MHDQEIGGERLRALEHLERRGDRNGDAADVVAAGDLEPDRPVVAETIDLELPVEKVEDVVAVHRHRRCESVSPARGPRAYARCALRSRAMRGRTPRSAARRSRRSVGVPVTRRSGRRSGCRARCAPCTRAGAARRSKRVDVEAELPGVVQRGPLGGVHPGARTADRASPRRLPASGRLGCLGCDLARADARRAAAGAGTRSADRRRTRRAGRADAGSARPQYGHSKSPYSTRVTGAVSRPTHVVDLGVDRQRQVDDRPGRACQRARLRRRGDQRRARGRGANRARMRRPPRRAPRASPPRGRHP